MYLYRNFECEFDILCSKINFSLYEPEELQKTFMIDSFKHYTDNVYELNQSILFHKFPYEKDVVPNNFNYYKPYILFNFFFHAPFDKLVILFKTCFEENLFKTFSLLNYFSNVCRKKLGVNIYEKMNFFLKEYPEEHEEILSPTVNSLEYKNKIPYSLFQNLQLYKQNNHNLEKLEKDFNFDYLLFLTQQNKTYYHVYQNEELYLFLKNLFHFDLDSQLDNPLSKNALTSFLLSNRLISFIPNANTQDISLFYSNNIPFSNFDFEEIASIDRHTNIAFQNEALNITRNEFLLMLTSYRRFEPLNEFVMNELFSHEFRITEKNLNRFIWFSDYMPIESFQKHLNYYIKKLEANKCNFFSTFYFLKHYLQFREMSFNKGMILLKGLSKFFTKEQNFQLSVLLEESLSSLHMGGHVLSFVYSNLNAENKEQIQSLKKYPLVQKIIELKKQFDITIEHIIYLFENESFILNNYFYHFDLSMLQLEKNLSSLDILNNMSFQDNYAKNLSYMKKINKNIVINKNNLTASCNEDNNILKDSLKMNRKELDEIECLQNVLSSQQSILVDLNTQTEMYENNKKLLNGDEVLKDIYSFIKNFENINISEISEMYEESESQYEKQNNENEINKEIEYNENVSKQKNLTETEKYIPYENEENNSLKNKNQQNNIMEEDMTPEEQEAQKSMYFNILYPWIDVSELPVIEDQEEQDRILLTKIMENSAKPKLVINENQIQKINELKEELPNFSEFIDFFVSQIKLNLLSKEKMFFKPMLLLGNPGLGKTYVVQALADILNNTFQFIDFGSMSAAFILKGGSKQWKDANIGLILKKMISSNNINPIFLYDEIDKNIGMSKSYDPTTVLFQLFEKTNATHFEDEYLGLTFDACSLINICTANDTNNFHDALLSRVEVFDIKQLEKEDNIKLIHKMYSKVISSYGIFDSTLSEDIVEELSTKTPREINNYIQKMIAKNIQNISLDNLLFNKKDKITLQKIKVPQVTKNKIGF